MGPCEVAERYLDSSRGNAGVNGERIRAAGAEGVGPNWIELQGRVSYDVNVLLEYIQRNTRVASVRAAMEETREAV